MEMDKQDAVDFFAELFHGEHHIPGKIKEFGPGWCVNYYGDMATFDFNSLTHLVFLAHDKCIRASIQSSGPKMIKIAIHKRKAREGSMYERHPTIETALAMHRKYYPEAAN